MGLAGAALIFGAFLFVYMAVMAVTVYTRRKHARAILPYRNPYDFSVRIRGAESFRRPGGTRQRRRVA